MKCGKGKLSLHDAKLDMKCNLLSVQFSSWKEFHFSIWCASLPPSPSSIVDGATIPLILKKKVGLKGKERELWLYNYAVLIFNSLENMYVLWSNHWKQNLSPYDFLGTSDNMIVQWKYVLVKCQKKGLKRLWNPPTITFLPKFYTLNWRSKT